MANANSTPRSNRIHIGIYGKTNSGKSSLINAFTHQDVSIVSSEEGTTTDPVYKAMEIYPLGPCVLIDTAGFDDETALGEVRKEKTILALEKSDIAIIVISGDSSYTSSSSEAKWYEDCKKRNTPVMFVVTKSDLYEEETKQLANSIYESTKEAVVIVSNTTGTGIDAVKETLISLVPDATKTENITGNLVSKEDVVLLVMPQDIQAPKGRLILPQVQTIRELLDKHCIVLSVSTYELDSALQVLKDPPKLIITDSQVFDYVYQHKPAESLLTSFSVLFAGYKGDISYYIDSVKAIDSLTEQSKVLIAECCTHAPLSEDIGREKIPNMLHKRVGQGLTVDIVAGTNWVENVNDYDLIIQCGACMFNKKYVMARINKAKEKGVPMTNYGITIAYVKGILDKISY